MTQNDWVMIFYKVMIKISFVHWFDGLDKDGSGIIHVADVVIFCLVCMLCKFFCVEFCRKRPVTYRD